MTHLDTPWGRDLSAPFDHELYLAFDVTEGHGGKTWVVQGLCPYCAGEVKNELEREGVPSDASDLVAQSEAADVLMVECTCSKPHSGRPAGVRGCGQMWTLEMEAS